MERARLTVGADRSAASWSLARPLALTLSVHLLARAAVIARGAYVSSEGLWSGWQVLDRSWLVSDPLGSMAALHSQPPLRNLLLSVIGLAAPGDEVAVLRVLHLMLGVAAVAAMLDVLRRLGVRAPVAVGATLVWSVSPAALLWEQNLSYNYPLAAVLVLMAWCFCVAAQRASARWLWIAAGVAAVPALTWSMFHLLWLAAIFAAVALTRVFTIGRVLATAAVPLVLVTAWYTKNLVLFDQFAASTWTGMNVVRVALAGTTQTDLEKLVDAGQVPPVALIPTFTELEAYRGLVAMPPPRGHPALDDPKKHDRSPNFNHRANLAISDAYLGAAWSIIRARPLAYPRGVASSLCIYTKPATDYWAVYQQRLRISAYNRLYNAVVYGQFVTPHLQAGCQLDALPRGQIPLLLPMLIIAAIAFAVRAAFSRSTPDYVRVTMAVIAATMLWILLAGTAFEHGENNRFRMVIEPLMWISFGVLADDVITRARTARQRTRAADRPPSRANLEHV